MTFQTPFALLAEALATRSYAEPTPVQAAVLEPDAQGRDLIVSAQTGSGKTVAFGLAMAPQLLDAEGNAPPAGAPLALIIAPTRELALQVSRELMWLLGAARVRVATCVGGMDASKERRALSHGTHIVVGTPGRLRDHLERGALDLTSIAVAVLDEADEMLDMGFREDLEELLDATPEGRRTLLFSATMPKPIVALARRYQRDALIISTVGADRGHGDISYQAVTVAPADIENAVVNLLRYHEAETAILFCATRDNVRHLHASLTERGFAAVALSGEHSQNERNHALQALRDRRARVCVATDVAARGIDLPSLSLVVHVELPRDAEALQHRSGRTGRAGKKGVAALIVPYQRRRRVEGMMRDARIQVEWIPTPTAAAIAAADRARLLATLAEPTEIDDEDRAIGADLLESRDPLEIAAMLVRAHRARLPAAEDLLDGPAAPRERLDGPRAGFEDTVWFRVNIGRRHNADPRWLLPLLCRRGHITKQDVGAIRIAQDETRFEIPRAAAGRFVASLKRTSGQEGDGEVQIEPADAPPQGGGGGRGPRPVLRPGQGPGQRSGQGAGPRAPQAPGQRFQPRPTRPGGRPPRRP